MEFGVLVFVEEGKTGKPGKPSEQGREPIIPALPFDRITCT